MSCSAWAPRAQPATSGDPDDRRSWPALGRRPGDGPVAPRCRRPPRRPDLGCGAGRRRRPGRRAEPVGDPVAGHRARDGVDRTALGSRCDHGRRRAPRHRRQPVDARQALRPALGRTSTLARARAARRRGGPAPRARATDDRRRHGGRRFRRAVPRRRRARRRPAPLRRRAPARHHRPRLRRQRGRRRAAESIHVVHEACPATRIMLGGRAVPPGLVEAGYTRVDNSMDVLSVAEHLLVPGPPDPRSRPPADAASGATRAAALREAAYDSDPVAERMAEVTEGATAMARDYARRAGVFKDLTCRDPVTELGNRRAFDDRMHARSADSDSGHGALLMIDVDGFKVVNDTHGPAAGDVLLRPPSASSRPRRWAATTSSRGSAGTSSGSCSPGRRETRPGRWLCASPHAVAAAADLPVTVSIGLTPLQGSPRGTLLAAYLALYEAKAAGGNGVRESAGAPVPPVARRRSPECTYRCRGWTSPADRAPEPSRRFAAARISPTRPMASSTCRCGSPTATPARSDGQPLARSQRVHGVHEERRPSEPRTSGSTPTSSGTSRSSASTTCTPTRSSPNEPPPAQRVPAAGRRRARGHRSISRFSRGRSVRATTRTTPTRRSATARPGRPGVATTTSGCSRGRSATSRA